MFSYKMKTKKEMINMNGKTDGIDTENKRDISTVVVATIGKLAVAAAIIYATGTISYINGFYEGKRKTAERAKWALYEPAGNGGAIAEINGYISERRQKMYADMNKVYSAAMTTPLENKDRLMQWLNQK
jgi:hypothetical protein